MVSGMALRIEWDISKAEKNLRKHGVSFAEAQVAPCLARTAAPDSTVDTTIPVHRAQRTRSDHGLATFHPR